MRDLSYRYGIVFDCPAENDKCPENPDIAGLGVVLSFVLAAITTTIASMIAAILDGVMLDKDSFLPLQFQRWLNRGRSEKSLLQARRWRRTLERLVLSFADQQLVSGFALLVSGFCTAYAGNNMMNSHWSLVVYLSCLSSSTHFAGILTLRRYFDRYRAASIVRVCLILSFSALLIAAISTSISFSVFFLPFRILVSDWFGDIFTEENGRENGREKEWARVINGVWYTGCTLTFLYIFYIAIIQLVPGRKRMARAWMQTRAWPALRKWLGLRFVGMILRSLLGPKTYATFRRLLATTIWHIIFPGPGSIFAVQIGFTIIALTFSLAQKFAGPTQTDLANGCHCSLDSPSENKMGFGQILAIVFLLLPVLFAWETYIEQLRPDNV